MCEAESDLMEAMMAEQDDTLNRLDKVINGIRNKDMADEDMINELRIIELRLSRL